MIPVVSLLLSCSTDAAQDTAERVDRPRPPLLIDADGDGYSPPEDCDDTRPEVNPGAADPSPMIGEPLTDWDRDCDGLYLPHQVPGSRTVRTFDWATQSVGDADLDGTDDFSGVVQGSYYPEEAFALSGEFTGDGDPDPIRHIADADIGSSTFVDDFTGDNIPEFVGVTVGGIFLADGAAVLSLGGPRDLGTFGEGAAGGPPFPLVVRLGDIDGDGAEEVVREDLDPFDLSAILTPAALYSGEQTEPRSWVETGDRLDKVDVDGDGLTDLLTEEAVYFGADYALPGEYGLAAAWTLPDPEDGAVMCEARPGADLDGDGRDDVLRGCHDGGPGWVALLTLDPTTNGRATELGRIEGVASGDAEEVGTEYIGVGDGDGDGLGDVVVQGVTAEYTHTVLFSGARVRGAMSLSDFDPDAVACGDDGMMMADVSGDGRPDLVCGYSVFYNEHLFLW